MKNTSPDTRTFHIGVHVKSQQHGKCAQSNKCKKSLHILELVKCTLLLLSYQPSSVKAKAVWIIKLESRYFSMHFSALMITWLRSLVQLAERNAFLCFALCVNKTKFQFEALIPTEKSIWILNFSVDHFLMNCWFAYQVVNDWGLWGWANKREFDILREAEVRNSLPPDVS